MSTATTANKKESDKFKNLLGPTDAKLDREVREQLITARVGLLLRAPFFGNLSTRLKLVNADEWCPTAATDGRNFYYNSRFVDMLNPKKSNSCLDMRYFTVCMITLVAVVTVTLSCLTLPMIIVSMPT